MIDSMAVLNEQIRVVLNLQRALNCNLDDFLRNGIECAYSKSRYIVLPGQQLETSEVGMERIADSFLFSVRYFLKRIAAETNTTKIKLRYIISGDSSKEHTYTDKFENDALLRGSWEQELKDQKSFNQALLAQYFKSSDLCIKDKYRFGLIPLDLYKNYYEIDVEKMIAENRLKDGVYYIPLSCYEMFIDESKLSEMREEINLPILLVYENEDNPEETYFCLDLYSTGNNI